MTFFPNGVWLLRGRGSESDGVEEEGAAANVSVIL